MIDHLDMDMGDWAICGSIDEVERALRDIQSHTAYTRDDREVPIFNAPEIRRSGERLSVIVPVSQGGAGRGHPTSPAFNGRLETARGQRRVRETLRDERVRVGLTGSFNLNHFLMAQQVPRYTRLDRQPRAQLPHATALRHVPPQHGEEFCLTDETNVLLGWPSFYRYMVSKPLTAHLDDMLRAFEELIGNGLTDSASAYEGLRCRHRPYYALRRIEFVWEFDHPEPIAAVADMVVPLRSLGDESRMHRALVEGEELTGRQNSLAMTVLLSSGCSLTVYAKTNQRIRFEVRYREAGLERVLRGAGREGVRTTRHRPTLLDMVAQLRDDASERLSTALAALDAYRLANPLPTTAASLCALIGYYAGSPGLAITIIDALRVRASVVRAEGSPLAPALDRLMQAGILRRLAPRNSVLVPHADYVQAVAALQRGEV